MCVYRIFRGWKYIQANIYCTFHGMYEEYKSEETKYGKLL